MRYMMYYNSYGERDRARDLFRELPHNLKDNLASWPGLVGRGVSFLSGSGSRPPIRG